MDADGFFGGNPAGDGRVGREGLRRGIASGVYEGAGGSRGEKEAKEAVNLLLNRRPVTY